MITDRGKEKPADEKGQEEIMKKLLCGCLIFLEAVALSLALCAGNGGRGTPAKAESDSFVGTEITYDASVYEDYYIGQEKQGDNGWYLYGGLSLIHISAAEERRPAPRCLWKSEF